MLQLQLRAEFLFHIGAVQLLCQTENLINRSLIASKLSHKTSVSRSLHFIFAVFQRERSFEKRDSGLRRVTY